LPVNFLITGGAGFIGSHLADALFARGDKVTILDNLSTGTRENIIHIFDKLTFVQGDIRNQELVEQLTKDADVVLHMAAALGVETIMHHTVESVSINFTGSEIVMKAALKFDKRLLIASTSEIYGKNPKQPLSESDDRVVGTPQKIRWTYADAKALEEAIAFTLFTTHGLRQTTLRFFNTVGPRQTGRYGMVVPRFIQAALKNEQIPVHGDGTQSRVFCHVQDAVKAVLLVLDDNSTIGEVFNVGGVGETTINQLAKKIIERTNSTSSISYTPYSEAYPPGYEDMQRRVPDITKLHNHLNWQPVNSLDAIIDDIVAEKSNRY
jgi:UDP-glucose 4-epimerase